MNSIDEYVYALKRMNWGLTLVIGALLTISVMFIYSACYISDELPVRTLYKRQALWITAGAVSYFLFALYDYRKLRKMGPWFYMLSLVLLVVVLVVGVTVYGSKRWLLLVPPLGIGIQPSEFAKLSAIILLAGMLSRFGAGVKKMGLMIAVLAVVFVPMLLIFKEPDAGTAMIFLPVAFVMMFVAGIPLKRLILLVFLGVTVVGSLVTVVLAPERFGLREDQSTGVMQFVGIKQYHKRRLRGFLDPDKDPTGAGWNKLQSEISVGSGGKWGKGYKKGDQNVLGFLPRSVAPTDFIYSVIAEEMGFMGSSIVLFLFGVIILFGMHAALVAQDKMGRLLCVGVVTMMFIHTFMNIAMTIGCLPIIGLPLPFLSYGGTFMIVTMSSMGIVQSVYIRSRPRVRSL
ncbi:MAG: rod shape-determining protein RodA [Kiritimatiellae bacterium]|nr:rod shape-determining protein RodA [Kiritimatiellia bacterium]